MEKTITEIERTRAAQLQAERLLEAKEQSHRQQVSRLENQVYLFCIFLYLLLIISAKSSDFWRFTSFFKCNFVIYHTE